MYVEVSDKEDNAVGYIILTGIPNFESFPVKYIIQNNNENGKLVQGQGKKHIIHYHFKKHLFYLTELLDGILIITIHVVRCRTMPCRSEYQGKIVQKSLQF